MCTIPPPPPPPILPNVSSSTRVPKIVDVREPSFDYNTCHWAIEHVELRETCVRYKICVNKAPYKNKYKYFESKLQIGPTCGIVALSMLLKGESSPDELLNIAKLEGFTCNGEMFSCKHMLKLAEIAYNLNEVDNVKYTLKQGGLFSTETIDRLLNGAVLLVPYDADCNHTPCLKNGHTAHWALVCGIIITEDPGDNYEDNPRNIYVLCKHGKSQFLSAWNLAELAKSNNNLYEFSPKKGADGLVYILPEGGIGGENGLRDQFLMFENIS